MNYSLMVLILSAIGGFLPVLIWLWFWRKEDTKHPEPKKLIALAFIGGVISVIPVLKLEAIAYGALENAYGRFLVWAIIEELFKFGAAYFFVLRRKEVDEPMDYVIYLVTSALGFAAIENFLFIASPISDGLSLISIITGDLRFIGATLLHVAASAIIGITMAFGFYKRPYYKARYLAFGLILAIALHTFFNSSIIMFGSDNSLIISSVVWVIIVSLLLILEKIKKLHPVR